MRLAFALVSFFAFAGCNIPCPTRVEVTVPDGGVAKCVQSTDCPNSSSVLLCTSDMDHLRGCVACESSQCVRYTPAACP